MAGQSVSVGGAVLNRCQRRRRRGVPGLFPAQQRDLGTSRCGDSQAQSEHARCHQHKTGDPIWMMLGVPVGEVGARGVREQID